tara:strand:+ start:1710 stop:2000 length:291 start_codon:yes stop_codon:yes gene_type:complete
MSNENFLDLPKTDETQQPTPEEHYFSKSKNQWIMVSDMSDMHVRRAFKRLLRMIRLNQLIDISDANKDTFTKAEVLNEVNNIISHCETIKQKIEDN